jgi:hypothetical protein
VRLAACAAFTAALTGCSSHGRAPAPPSYRPKIVVTRDDHALPARCSVRRTTSRVVDFIDAFNRGDAGRLDRSIADPQHFRWYSVDVGHGTRSRAFAARDRGAALRYLASRSKAGERMRLVQLMVRRIPDELAGVEFEVTLDAPHFTSFPGRNRLAGGKGAFGCSDGRLVMWVVGLDTSDRAPIRQELLCRRASRAKRDARRVIACSAWSARTAH